MQVTPLSAEATRQLDICNACRYCEGFCAVFPALERRRTVEQPDVKFLANLCHGCKGCFYGCQYAPPHEFGINIPQILASVRRETYREYAWPRFMGRAFDRNGAVVAGLTVAAMLLAILAVAALLDSHALFGRHSGPGAFYAVIPKGAMTAVAGVTFLFSLVAMGVGGLRFWREVGRGDAHAPAQAAGKAVSDILTLRNLGGGGHGCNDVDETFSQRRRVLHHAMFYGLGLCFASTVSGWVLDTFFAWPAPYPLLSLPVVLGTVGGIGLAIGTIGLLALKQGADPRPLDPRMTGADIALLVLLAAVALTGLGLLAVRETAAMGVALVLHLSLVLALFVALPYSKFVHGVYRGLALLKDRRERSTPPPAG